jgi:hypothetical protein
VSIVEEEGSRVATHGQPCPKEPEHLQEIAEGGASPAWFRGLGGWVSFAARLCPAAAGRPATVARFWGRPLTVSI